MLEAYLLSIAAGATIEVSKKALAVVAHYVEENHPDIAARFAEALSKGDGGAAQLAAADAVGVIVAEAGTGAIQMDKATLEALKAIRFDHQHGRVKLGNTTLSADELVTGGSAGATGQTDIGGDTTLSSQGTKIKVGKGAGIKIVGNASIKQN